MPGLSELFTYHVTDGLARLRFKDVTAYRFFTSGWFMALFLLLLVLTIGAGVLDAMSILLPVNLSALSLLLLSITGIIFLLFVYGFTFFPYHRYPKTPAELITKAGGQKVNIADGASFSLLNTLRNAKEVVPEELPLQALLALFSGQLAREFLDRLELSQEECQQAIMADVLPFLTWGDFAHNALNIANQARAQAIDDVHALAVFFLHPKLQPYLRQKKIRETDIWFMIRWFVLLKQENLRHRRWWDEERLLAFTGVGLSWAAGLTPIIDRISRIPQGNLWDTAYARQTEMEELIISLARSEENNVLIVGHPGVGRLGVVKELARRIRLRQAHAQLNDQRVIYIHVGQLLSMAGSASEQLQVVTRALNEMERAGNIIAVLDGVGSILGGSKEAGVNLTDVLAPFFASKTIRVVVIMSNDEYHVRLEGNDELMHLFDVIQIKPLLPEATLELLALSVPIWEEKTGMFLPYKTLREVVEDTRHIMPQVPYPEKAFDVLEEALVKAQSAGMVAVQISDIQEMIAKRIGVHVGVISQAEDEKLLSLEDAIHKRVINQERGVTAVARAMIRARAGIRTVSRPVGTFLFLGPSGVGKTETAKALAEAYFGDEAFLQRLDMSEYQTDDGLHRLIGTIDHATGRLTQMIADHPFCVLLLDEFEKASLSVQQLFLQVLDEGRLSDARGREYSFKHAIIIATSNAGAEFIRQRVSVDGHMPEDFDKLLNNYLLEQGIFKPELLNRFDGVITFVPLSVQHIEAVARLMLAKLNQRIDSEHGVTIQITQELVDLLVQIGYSPQFGARPMARAIQNTVEYAVAQRVIKRQVSAGHEITLPIQELQDLAKSI